MKPKDKKVVKKTNDVKTENKKTLKGLMMDEDGYVSKETILKVGLATIAGLGVLGAATNADAWYITDHNSHQNSMLNNGSCYVHSNVTTHTSY